MDRRRALALALALGAVLVGCGGAGHKRPPASSNPDLNLPASGSQGITPVQAGPGGAQRCAARGPIYVETPLGGAKRVALTFDDGPSDQTHLLLDELEHAHVHATFFVIGNQVADFPEVLRRELTDGDFVGNHTWTHAEMPRLPIEAQLRQLVDTQQAIAAATGFQTCIWRAPYGAINDQLKYLARALGLISVQWYADPQDFTAPPAATIVQRVLHGNPHNPDNGVMPGAIVLMHDGGGNRIHTIQAVPKIIAALRVKGYRFVTIPELLGLPVARRPGTR